MVPDYVKSRTPNPMGLTERWCYLCGDNESLEVHHIDYHHENNHPGNRVVLCRPCHVWLHQYGYMSAEELEQLHKKGYCSLRGE